MVPVSQFESSVTKPDVCLHIYIYIYIYIFVELDYLVEDIFNS